MSKITGWSIIDGFRFRRVLRPYLLRVQQKLPSENVADVPTVLYARAVELASLEHPSNWLVFYVLGSKRLELNQLSASLAAALRCIELRPNDIRSVYSLATTYNALSYGGWSDDILETIRSRGARQIAANISEMREAARRDLMNLNLTPSEAAEMAAKWFRRCLELKPDRWSLGQIEEHLRTLAWIFPKHLIT